MGAIRSSWEATLRRACDGFVVLFGVWSVLSQAVSLLGGSPRLLGRLSLLVPLPAAAILWAMERAARRFRPEAGRPAAAPSEARHPQWAALAGAVGLAAFYTLTQSYRIFWPAACLFAGVFYVLHLKAPSIREERDARPAPTAAEIAVCTVLAVVVVAATLFVHRMYYDDSLYVGVAADVWDHPGEPIMGRDTMHGIPGLPFVAPQHRVRTYDVLVGLASRALRIRPMAAAHLLFPPLFGLLFLAAAARLFRLLLGRAWLYGLAAAVLLLLANGDIEASFGNSAFVLLFEGRTIMATIMVPLLAAYALEHVSGLRPAPVTLGLIGLALPAAIALSTNALFLGPLAVGLSAAAAWRPDRRSTVRLLGAALVCLIPVGLGLALRKGSVPELFYMTTAMESSWMYQTQRSMIWVLGGRLFLPFWITAMLAGWAFIPDRARRRWMLGYSWRFILFCMNPFLTPFWVRHVTSAISFFRLYWAIPLPFFLSALLVGLAAFVSRRWKPAWRPAALGLTLLLFALFVPARWTTARANGSAVGLPRLKVVPSFYRTAERMAALTPPGGMALAPETVAAWIPTMPGHPAVVTPRRIFLDQLKTRLPEAEYFRRVALFEYVSGEARRLPKEGMEALFGEAIDELNVRSVAILRSNRWLADIERFLRGRGFRRVESPCRFFRLFVCSRPARESGRGPVSPASR